MGFGLAALALSPSATKLGIYRVTERLPDV